ncbi:MAG: hypothetical protein AAF587_29590 [Bacteroidota bacterium]
MTAAERRELQMYLDLKKRIASATAPDIYETPSKQKARIKRLLKKPLDFFKHYFPHYLDADFGWFHKKAIRDATNDRSSFIVAEWPREHAKSVLFDIMLALYLLADGWLTGMILASDTEKKAQGLIGDIQAELEANLRFIHDFGNQKPSGGWADGHFVTQDGVGFWAFGMGQNPAGAREGEKRPNYGVIDDADNKRKARNQQRIEEDVDWVLGEFFGCLSIKESLKVYCNNRVHRKGLTAHIVGDIEPGDSKRKGINHIKVYATEGRRHQRLLPDAGGQPAWKERYTLHHITKRMGEMGWANAMRQFFHHHEEKGHTFKKEMIHWVKPLAFNKYDKILTYCDPSWKSGAKNDFKAIVLIGKKKTNYHILWAWVRQTSISNMVKAHYIAHDLVPSESIVQHWLEANLMQDDHIKNYKEFGEEDNQTLRIRVDKRKKPNKYDRIENLEPLMTLKRLSFNVRMKNDPDMQTLINQFLAFPFGFDDGPDAVEGGIHKIDRMTKKTGKAKMGRSKQNNQRRM